MNIGDSCFITLKTTSGFILNILINLLPLFIEISIIFYFILKSLKVQKKGDSETSKYLLVYPIICLVAFGSFFSQKLYETILDISCGCDYTWHSISFILCASNGFLNSIFYGLNSSIGF